MKGFIQDLKKILYKYNLAKPEEEMISYEVVYEPDTVDTHGNWASKETLEKACESFNENLGKGIVKSNLFHLQDTESFTVEDTWIHKEFDVIVKDTNEPIKAGSWIAKVQYNDSDLWELKKAGVIGGVSIGCMGEVDQETGEITSLDFGTPLGEQEDGEN